MVSWAVCLNGSKNKPELDWRSAALRYRATCSCATSPGSTREIWAVWESKVTLQPPLYFRKSNQLALRLWTTAAISYPSQFPLPSYFSSFTEGGGEVSRNVSTPIPWPMGVGERTRALHQPVSPSTLSLSMYSLWGEDEECRTDLICSLRM